MKKIILFLSSVLLAIFIASAKSNVYALGFSISSSYEFSELAKCKTTYEYSKKIEDKL